MKKINSGFSFGLTSGIITTIGLLTGLSNINDKKIIITGILTIAIADAFSDALGIHISEESNKKNDKKSIWKSTIITLFTKLLIASSFLIPILLLEINKAIIISYIYGITLLILFSYIIAKKRKEKPIGTIIEHIAIAIIVIIITKFISIYI